MSYDTLTGYRKLMRFLVTGEMPHDTNVDRVLYWSDIAELTHATQVANFGFCTCEDGPKVYADCDGGVL